MFGEAVLAHGPVEVFKGHGLPEGDDAVGAVDFYFGVAVFADDGSLGGAAYEDEECEASD